MPHGLREKGIVKEINDSLLENQVVLGLNDEYENQIILELNNEYVNQLINDDLIDAESFYCILNILIEDD